MHGGHAYPMLHGQRRHASQLQCCANAHPMMFDAGDAGRSPCYAVANQTKDDLNTKDALNTSVHGMFVEQLEGLKTLRFWESGSQQYLGKRHDSWVSGTTIADDGQGGALVAGTFFCGESVSFGPSHSLASGRFPSIFVARASAAGFTWALRAGVQRRPAFGKLVLLL
jgi:hypothetical protein